MRPDDWHDPDWQAAAHGWITERLEALGTPVTGRVQEVRARPWSVTHRVPTAAGYRWFKANTEDCAYEAALAEALGGWAPDAVLVPLAVDAARGWLLTADHGPTLREALGDADRLGPWVAMLQAYAVLQRTVAPRAATLIAQGVPDQRPAAMPAQLASLLADPAADPGARRARIEAMPFTDWCAELAADGLPASVQHDDLHDDNVFPDGPTGYRFFDWGDASVGHPFGTLLVTLRSYDGADTAARHRLRDAYLEVWSDLASPVELRRSAELACRVGPVSRALAWRRCLRNAAMPLDDGVRTAVADWLGELTATPPTA